MSMRFGNMKLNPETITPQIAERWLEQNDANRNVRRGKVEQYARDMRGGSWQMIPIAICFDEQGKLGNGQHRLKAIVESGKAQVMLVARDCTREQIAAMDLGITRTVNDIAHFLGEQITSRHASVARVIVDGPSYSGYRSFQELLDVYEQHKDVIDRIVSRAPNKTGFSASALAVCAIALYSCSELKVFRFMEVLSNGIVDGPHEIAAIRFRDYCMAHKSQSSLISRAEVFDRCKAALDAFVHDRPITKLYAATDRNPFPMPNAAKAPSSVKRSRKTKDASAEMNASAS